MKDEEKTAEGQSFYSEALTGSGTINLDGTYGPPEPDPTVVRGGPGGARTSPGGVERQTPSSLIPPAQRRAEEAESKSTGSSSTGTKRSTSK